MQDEKEQPAFPEIGICANSGPWWMVFFSFCIWTIVLPVLFFEVFDVDSSVLIGWIFLGTGIAYFLWSIRPVFFVPCQPPAPEEISVLGSAAETMEQHVLKRIYIIVNPYGGLKKGLGILEQVKPIFEAAGIEVDVRNTEFAGHAEKYGASLDFETVDAIVAIGGDGTFHELMNGIFSRSEGGKVIPVGLIPGGSGNSVLYSCKNLDPQTAARQIATGRSFLVDAMQLRDEGVFARWGLNVIGLGITCEAGGNAEKARFLGPARYDICGLWSICLYHNKQFTLTISGVPGKEPVTRSLRAPICYIVQNQHFGKGLRAGPFARMDDGLMDLVLIDEKKYSRGGLLSAFQLLPTGRVPLTENEFFQAEMVEVTPEFPERVNSLNLDGERFPFQGKLTIRTHKHRFRMLNPLGPISSDNDWKGNEWNNPAPNLV